MKGKQKGNFYTKNKIKYLNMLNSGRAKYNSKGNIVKEAIFQKTGTETSNIESKRLLFNDVKVVNQNDLELYRNNIKMRNPYEVLLSTGNVPYSIINNDVKQVRNRDLTGCFGSKEQTKKPRLAYSSLEELKKCGETQLDKLNEKKERETEEDKDSTNKKRRIKGQSERIWNELYKVLDSSDVIVHVVDVRDPEGTKCDKILEYVKKQAQHKHLIYVLNKVDLVPTSVTAKWMRIFSREYPTVGLHSNGINNNYGKNNLINLIRQLKTLYNKKQISVGFVGYPNCGKSSIINVLRNEEVCKTAPVPGQTRVWQYIMLTREIYLIDCPGVVPVSDLRDAVLKGAIHVEKIDDPDTYIGDVIKKVGKKKLEKIYGIEFEDIEEMFEKMGRRYGKLVKGGEPNVNLISKLILHDWHRGKIPYFTVPKESEGK